MTGAHRLSTSRDHAEFEIIHQALAQTLCEIAHNERCQSEQLPLPRGIFHLDHQAGPDEFCRTCIGCDPFPYGLGPYRNCHLFGRNDVAGKAQLSNELAGAFHCKRNSILASLLLRTRESWRKGLILTDSHKAGTGRADGTARAGLAVKEGESAFEAFEELRLVPLCDGYGSQRCRVPVFLRD